MRVRWRVTAAPMIGADVWVMCGGFPLQGRLSRLTRTAMAEASLFCVAGLAAAVVPLAYLADRFLDPGVAGPRKHVISGDCLQACQ
jgi:hypothetical protein